MTGFDDFERKQGHVSFIGVLEGIVRTGARVFGLAGGLVAVAVGATFLWVLWNYGLNLVSWHTSLWRDSIVILFIKALDIGFGVVGICFIGHGVQQIVPALRFTSALARDTHGRARLATARELRKAGLMPRHRDSIYLGRLVSGTEGGKEVGYPGRVNLITIGPAGSGKGSGIIVPNLATLRRSILIIDPKGEAAAMTARKRAQFGRVVMLNPFNVLADKRPWMRSTGFNPLAALDPTHDDFSDNCVSIAQALIKERGGGNSAFFEGSAQDLLSALIMHEKWERREKASLANVRKMLTEPFAGDAQGALFGLARTVFDMTKSPCEPLRSKAGRFTNGNRSTRDVIATAINETRFLDSPPLQRDLQGEDLDWDSMKRRTTTVYLVLPADRLETHANYLRLVVTSALRALLRSPPPPTLPPVLFMLDEFAQLGYLAPIENGMAIARGFGVQLWPFLQDLNQLNALYKDRWQTFLGNAEVLTAFAPRDVFTAQYLSARCDNKTIIVESENDRTDSIGMGRGRGPQGVPLFRPGELMAMNARQMLCFIEPVKNPFFAAAPATSWRGLDRNPYHRE